MVATKVDYIIISVPYKISIFQGLLKYMIPMFVVYFAEYEINQGLVSCIFKI